MEGDKLINISILEGIPAIINDPTNSGVEFENLDPNVPLMDKPFDPTMIKIDTKTPSLDTIIERIEHKEIELETESYFQRNPDLWDDTKKSRLIESILIQFPLPAFYFDGTDNKKWLVVDGLQRLSSIRSFVVDKTLKLTNLEFLTNLNGLGYDDLGRDLQRIIKSAQVVVYVILPGTPTDVKYNIFKRINTGGLTLVAQEIRHALFQGEPAKFISQLALRPKFIEATGKSLKVERMLDRDFANRFLAFYHLGYESYQPDLDTYMSKAMASVHSMSEIQKEEIVEAFDRSMQLNIDVFGRHAFRKFFVKNEGRSPINKALFDVFSVSFAKLTMEEIKLISDRKEQFLDDFINLLYHDYENAFFWSVTSSTSDKNRVLYRFKKVQELIEKTIRPKYELFNVLEGVWKLDWVFEEQDFQKYNGSEYFKILNGYEYYTSETKDGDYKLRANIQGFEYLKNFKTRSGFVFDVIKFDKNFIPKPQIGLDELARCSYDLIEKDHIIGEELYKSIPTDIEHRAFVKMKRETS